MRKTATKLFGLAAVLAMCLTGVAPAAAAEELVVTVNDEGIEFTGGWSDSSLTGPADGPTKWTSDAAATVTYPVAEAEPGFYDLYHYMVVHTSALPRHVDVRIAHSCEDATAEPTEVAIDYTTHPAGTRVWEYLGTYQFDGSEDEFVQVQLGENSDSGSILRAAGVKLTPVGSEADQVCGLPNTQPVPSKALAEGEEWLQGTDDQVFTTTGEWNASSLVLPGHNSGYYSTANNSSATWYPYLEAARNVDISLLKVRQSASEDPALRVEVHAQGVTTSRVIDTSVGESEWVYLGRYHFSGDGSEYVRITRESGQGVSRATVVKYSIGVPLAEPASVFDGRAEQILERLGMVSGVDVPNGFLKQQPTRVEAAAMLLSLLGLEDQANDFEGTDNFDDADDAPEHSNLLAYLKAHPELGIEPLPSGLFAPNEPITRDAYLGVLLHHLGYVKGEDYIPGEESALARDLGISTGSGQGFDLGELTGSTTDALAVNLKNSDTRDLLSSIMTSREGIIDSDYPEDGSFTDSMRKERDEAKHRSRGLIYNNDGNDTYVPYPEYPDPFDISTVTEPMTHENFLSKRTTGIEDTQVESIFYGTGVFDSYTHRSSGETEIRQRDWTPVLADIGMDSLETMIDFSQDNDLEILWSFRMNDTHDRGNRVDQLDGWKRANPELLMGARDETVFIPYSNSSYTAVDFTHEASRQKVYDILKDVVTRYDVDGIELDFTRFLSYFKEVAQGETIHEENVERMTDLVRAIRTMTEEESMRRGRPIVVSILVADSIGYNYEVGLDVETWLEEDLFDMVSLRNDFRLQPWIDSVADYSAWDVPVYAVFNMYHDLGYNEDNIQTEAAQAWSEGVDGIYLYNMVDQHAPMLDVIGSPETAGEPDPNYRPAQTYNQASYTLKNWQDYFGGFEIYDPQPTDPPTEEPSPTPTETATPAPTATPTSTPPAIPSPPDSGPLDIYTTPGVHQSNGRQWFTECEPYSQTIRCNTEIWATQVQQVGGTYVSTTGWTQNNLTYMGFMTREAWANNPLGYAGEWVADDGRRWRTECDTASTGRNGCRSFTWTSFIASELGADESWRYFPDSGWVMNNIVRFSG